MALSSRVTLGRLARPALADRPAGLRDVARLPARETQNWLRTGQMGLAARLQGEQRLETLGENALDVPRRLPRRAGRRRLRRRGAASFRRVAGYALPPDADGERAAARRRPARPGGEGEPRAARHRRARRLPAGRVEPRPGDAGRAARRPGERRRRRARRVSSSASSARVRPRRARAARPRLRVARRRRPRVEGPHAARGAARGDAAAGRGAADAAGGAARQQRGARGAEPRR